MGCREGGKGCQRGRHRVLKGGIGCQDMPVMLVLPTCVCVCVCVCVCE